MHTFNLLLMEFECNLAVSISAHGVGGWVVCMVYSVHAYSIGQANLIPMQFTALAHMHFPQPLQPLGTTEGGGTIDSIYIPPFIAP